MLTAFLTYSLKGSTRGLYLPGPTSAGHHQIEIKCETCHSQNFSDRKALQAACVECHGSELKEAEDSHPEAKFLDPRNAARVAVLDARYCVTCHREHRPELTSSMGLSLPQDYCFRCHEDIGEERATHRGLAFDSCQNAGCHNFHDNRALYEDFLLKHLDEPVVLANGRNPALVSGEAASVPTHLSIDDADAPVGFALSGAELTAWVESAHGHGGVNCSDCHRAENQSWQKDVASERCGECHEAQRQGFLMGRHGMREDAGLPALLVGDARQPMRSEASERSLGCTSCHGAHRFDTRRAAVEACLGCHADEHSNNYRASRHAALFDSDASGSSGASCATCHLPRVRQGETLQVLHNQNATLRPNEKMVRDVCMNCHGLSFALDALADPTLIAKNFAGSPSQRVESLEWARSRSR